MKILVLGCSGMLGHKLLQLLAGDFEIAGTVRGSSRSALDAVGMQAVEIFPHVDAQDFPSIEGAVAAWRPDVVINCIGVIKQVEASVSADQIIEVNALFPHKLAIFCQAKNIRLIHFSTDCVFSGRKGDYTEDDIPDPVDLYGRSKLLGEVAGHGILTLRTSIVGRELERHTSLIAWFLSQADRKISGYAKAIYSGLTTIALARLLKDILAHHADLDGIWHVSADAISKYDLLGIVNRIFGTHVDIAKDTDFVCDRSLSCEKFKAKTGFVADSWEAMIRELAEDPTPYPTPLPRK
jgi:dTDP-4-dehydrorhamnose reductase